MKNLPRAFCRFKFLRMRFLKRSADYERKRNGPVERLSSEFKRSRWLRNKGIEMQAGRGIVQRTMREVVPDLQKLAMVDAFPG